MFQLTETHGEVMRWRQFLDISDRDQRMLVDRVLVEEIADDAASDLFEIGKYLSEQSHFMHREQRVVDAFAILHHVQDQPARFWIVGEHAVGRKDSLPN